MKQLIRVMKALTDPNRIRIMKMLELKEMCVCEIGAVLAIPQPTVSSHLKILENAELIASRKDGLWVNYRLAEAPGSRYAQDMQRQLATWLDKEPSVEGIIEQARQVNRLQLTRKSEVSS